MIVVHREPRRLVRDGLFVVCKGDDDKREKTQVIDKSTIAKLRYS